MAASMAALPSMVIFSGTPWRRRIRLSTLGVHADALWGGRVYRPQTCLHLRYLPWPSCRQRAKGACPAVCQRGNGASIYLLLCGALRLLDVLGHWLHTADCPRDPVGSPASA